MLLRSCPQTLNPICSRGSQEEKIYSSLQIPLFYLDACAPGNPKDASVEDLKDLFRKIMA